MNSSVHPDVEEITLDNLIRAGKEPKKEGSLGPSQADSWVLEELKIRGENLKSEMEKLKKQRREYKGVKGKESELKVGFVECVICILQYQDNRLSS